MENIEKFLEFNGKRISVLLADGSWWVAIKPICEALKVNYDRQYKNILDDEILTQLYAKQHTVGGDGRLREMVCLPEKYIYGWLFSIRSESHDLKKYKLICYDILYNHFHGTLTDRMNALHEKSSIDTRIQALEEQLKESSTYKEILELRQKKKQVSGELRKLDNDLQSGQLRLSF